MDPASLQLLISRLAGIADEMGAVLRRGAFSPNIKERADCSAAVFTPDGELLAQAEHIPVHLGSMPASVSAAIDSDAGQRIAPGEQIVLNDPHAGGTHVNDVTLVAPCFGVMGTEQPGDLVGWVANRAHHADVGGMTPGSIPPDARELVQEGFILPPVLLTDEVVALFAANSRTGTERRRDLAAQRGANAVGVRRLAGMAGAPFHEAVAHGERRMRAALASLPDGVYAFEDVMDSTGAGADQRDPARIAVEVTIRGERITFDFTGTAPQAHGNVNAVRAVTESAVGFALRSATDPGIPANGGAMRPVEVVAPAGTIVAAQPPAAVGAGNVEVSQRVADVCLGALAQAASERVPAASQGTMNNLLIGGTGLHSAVGTAEERTEEFVFYETVAGGQGARPGRDGMSGVQTNMTNTRNTPVEALEREFPLRVRRYALRRGSGGKGETNGGDGVERDLEVLVPATVSLVTERRESAPYGLDGGEPGARGENWLLPGGDESRAEHLPDKCTVTLAPGDVIRMLTPGGGGRGAPESQRR
ncbi:MAG: hydantoinase B/oxoprolinase family protein [Acidimicrobiia bacterium]|nr:hydantoinase B/oxoprolinase family protein [Acidimicrobiia bacterium]